MCHVAGVDVLLIIEELQEQAFEECGESADDWLRTTKDQNIKLEEKMNEVLSVWLEEVNEKPSFGRFSLIEKYNLITGERVD